MESSQAMTQPIHEAETDNPMLCRCSMIGDTGRSIATILHVPESLGRSSSDDGGYFLVTGFINAEARELHKGRDRDEALEIHESIAREWAKEEIG